MVLVSRSVCIPLSKIYRETDVLIVPKVEKAISKGVCLTYPLFKTIQTNDALLS